MEPPSPPIPVPATSSVIAIPNICLSQLLHPKLDRITSLARKMEMISCVEEIKIHEQDVSWLSPEYTEVGIFILNKFKVVSLGK